MLVSSDDILSTFSTKHKNTTSNYLSYLRLKGKIPLLQISKKLNIPYRTLQSWSYGSTPAPIKHVKFLEKLGAIPINLDENNEIFLLLVRCLAFVFGDGHINFKGTETIFTGFKDDLECLKYELENNFKIKCRMKPASGAAYHLIAPATLTRILLAMGAPRGNKIVQKFQLPSWLIKSPKKIKTEFLSTLFGNESNAIVRDSNTKNAFYPPQFSMNKSVEYEKSHVIFLTRIKELLKEFEIGTTKIKKFNLHTRKDGTKVWRYSFNIDRNLRNLIRFYLIVGFMYAFRKQATYEYRLRKKIGFLHEANSKIRTYHNVMRLRKMGYGDKKISKMLNINRSGVHHWIYHNVKPKYLDAEKEIQELINSFNSPA